MKEPTRVTRTIAILSILVILVGLASCVIFRKEIYIALYHRESLWRYEVENFQDNYESFKYMAEFAQKNVNPEEYGNYLSVDRNRIYSGQKKEYLSITDDEVAHIESIESCFTCKDANWETIRVDKNRVSFEIVNGQYAVVYSADDSKPTYVNGPNETNAVLTKKIRKNWYHVTKKIN